MNRNAKIALGCGGAGCLGLIVVVIAVAVLIVTGVIRAPGLYDANRNSNSDYNYNSDSNRNSTVNTNDNDNANSSSDSSNSSSMSDDDRHKLFQAAGMSGDNALIMRVLRKLGLSDISGSEYQQFTKDHGPWALRNVEWVQSVITPEKARAYVEAHIDD